MFPFIYVEESIQDHPRVQTLLKRFSTIPVITCQRYTEVFNRQSQNFRLQKQAPCLILAKKHENFVLPTPKGYGIGGERNYYFSHMLNCLFDCRYCFLQGMYKSAHYVFFVNFEEMMEGIEQVCNASNKPSYFFSGYDCDSLALDNVTHFTQTFLPYFEAQSNAILELRTKSTNIQPLLKRKPLTNCVTAFSLTPYEISSTLEHKTPSLNKRLEAIVKLQQAGWQIGLRFDPVIYLDDFEAIYSRFFERVFAAVDLKLIHSVSLGAFRLPRHIFKEMSRLYPDERLFAHSLNETQETVSYAKEIEKNCLAFCQEQILKRLSKEQYFPCFNWSEK